jgi:hypothetical protein
MFNCTLSEVNREPRDIEDFVSNTQAPLLPSPNLAPPTVAPGTPGVTGVTSLSDVWGGGD